jgi:hypothetical protein
MDDFTKGIVVIGVIIVLISIGLYMQYVELYKMEETLPGYWVAHDHFLHDHHYSDFQLFISPKSEGSYHGYALIARQNNIIYNSPVTIKLKLHKKNSLKVIGTIHFENHGDFEIQLPENANIVWSVTGEHIKITDIDNHNVIFDGYKDIYTSILSKKEWHDFQYQENFQE